jgi:hypothetical protein
MNLTKDDVYKWLESNIPTASSRKNYIARIKPIFNEIYGDDVLKSFKDKNLLKIILARGGSASTMKGSTQVFLKLIKEYPGLLEAVGKNVYETYNKFFLEANADMAAGYIQKVIVQDEEDAIEPFSEIKKKVFEEYPVGSDERLYMELYEIAPVRDDFGNLKIVSQLSDTTDETNNYYVSSNHQLIINEHKSKNKYGSLKYTLPKKVYKLIDTSKPLVFDRRIMSPFISKMLKKIGINGGGINVLRHAYLSEELDGENIKDPAIRKELFQRMAHSQSAQLGYIRKLKN